MSRLFVPSLEALVAAEARRPLSELWSDPAELARVTLDAAGRVRVGAILFPFDVLLLAESAGGSVAWHESEAELVQPGIGRLEEVEPADVVERGRIPAAVEATRFMATTIPVAAHVPSSSVIVEQFLSGPGNDEQVASAEDLATALARALLEAGASALVVRAGPGDPPEDGALRRLADHFGAPFVSASAGRNGTPTVAVSAIGDPSALERTLSSLPPGPVVLTDGPVPGDADRSRLAAVAARIAVGEGSAC